MGSIDLFNDQKYTIKKKSQSAEKINKLCQGKSPATESPAVTPKSYYGWTSPAKKDLNKERGTPETGKGRNAKESGSRDSAEKSREHFDQMERSYDDERKNGHKKSKEAKTPTASSSLNIMGQICDDEDFEGIDDHDKGKHKIKNNIASKNAMGQICNEPPMYDNKIKKEDIGGATGKSEANKLEECSSPRNMENEKKKRKEKKARKAKNKKSYSEDMDEEDNGQKKNSDLNLVKKYKSKTQLTKTRSTETARVSAAEKEKNQLDPNMNRIPKHRAVGARKSNDKITPSKSSVNCDKGQSKRIDIPSNRTKTQKKSGDHAAKKDEKNRGNFLAKFWKKTYKKFKLQKMDDSIIDVNANVPTSNKKSYVLPEYEGQDCRYVETDLKNKNNNKVLFPKGRPYWTHPDRDFQLPSIKHLVISKIIGHNGADFFPPTIANESTISSPYFKETIIQDGGKTKIQDPRAREGENKESSKNDTIVDRTLAAYAASLKPTGSVSPKPAYRTEASALRSEERCNWGELPTTRRIYNRRKFLEKQTVQHYESRKKPKKSTAKKTKSETSIRINPS